MILDLFAGPGGWSEGLRSLGLHDVGIEHDTAACKTRAAAGHLTVQADVAAYPTGAAGKVEGLIASPPCQAWSMAGKRAAVAEQDRLGRHVRACHEGWVPYDAADYADPRVPLVLEPLRWAYDLQPTWIALEQVPPVLWFWKATAHALTSWGYRAWCGVYNTADFGVPQTRKRAFLLAHREPFSLPIPTHAEKPEPQRSLWDAPPRKKWISMAEALGWHLQPYQRSTDRPAPVVMGNSDRWKLQTNRGQDDDGSRQEVELDRPAPAITSKAGGQWVFQASSQANAARRPIDAPAPTVLFGHALNDVRWVYERPATTIVGSYRPDVVAAPGYGTEESRQDAEGSVRITLEQAAVLQGFRSDYPWQGSKTKRFEQVGNAVPPAMAAAVLAPLLAVTGEEAHAAIDASIARINARAGDRGAS